VFLSNYYPHAEGLLTSQRLWSKEFVIVSEVKTVSINNLQIKVQNFLKKQLQNLNTFSYMNYLFTLWPQRL
jgi:hypothetical protein